MSVMAIYRHLRQLSTGLRCGCPRISIRIMSTPASDWPRLGSRVVLVLPPDDSATQGPTCTQEEVWLSYSCCRS
jgi:hypothetical protein